MVVRRSLSREGFHLPRRRNGRLLRVFPVKARLPEALPMSFLMACGAEGDQILGSVVAQSAPRQNVMDLKIFHPPARLTTPAVSFQNFMAELAIRLRVKPQAGPLCPDSHQIAICTSSMSCFLCGFGRPMTSRMRQGNRASRLPASKLTHARKSAQIISRQ